jgi:hypothetical protein
LEAILSSKEFFKATQEHSGASSITELEDVDGAVFIDQARMRESAKAIVPRSIPNMHS